MPVQVVLTDEQRFFEFLWFAWATRQVSPDGVMIERGEQRGGIHRRVKAGQAEGVSVKCDARRDRP